MFNVYLSDTVLAIRLEHVWLKNKKKLVYRNSHVTAIRHM